jgi:hypothetical protein
MQISGPGSAVQAGSYRRRVRGPARSARLLHTEVGHGSAQGMTQDMKDFKQSTYFQNVKRLKYLHRIL